MLLQNEHDLIALLGVAAFILLALAIGGGVIASLKSFQVRQFQDLLFKAERKIDTLERRMFNVLNAVPVALVETDVTGKFTFANRAAHQLLGRKDSELIGLRFHSATWGISYPDGRVIPADLMPIARTLRGQTVKGFQHMLTNHGSHEKVLVSVTSMPIMNGAGEVIGSTSAMVEIESSTGEGVDDLNGLWRGHWFAAATVPFWGLDAKGQILDINNAALDIFDLKREQALGQNWTQFFVEDGDFQKALDYLGEIQDDQSPHNQASAQLTLRVTDGDRQPSIVTAWVVRTHEGGERGLTVMALPASQAAELGPVPISHMAPSVAALDEDDAQELSDHRLAEEARAALGIGTWQYDADADTIVEDEGMMALIGREYVGGPTLISEADQAAADQAFGQLMTGETDHLALDLRVRRKDGTERWIALEGQARPLPGGGKQIYGVAFDCTAWKGEKQIETVVQTTGITEADLEIAVEKARIEALNQGLAKGLAEGRAEALTDAREAADQERERAVEAALTEANAKAKAELDAAVAAARMDAVSSDVYGWQSPPVSQPLPDPVIVHTPDPVVMAENDSLKGQLDALRNDYEQAEIRRDELQRQLDEIIFAKPIAVEAIEDPRIAELQAELDAARAAQTELQERLTTLANTPAPEPDFSQHEKRIDKLSADLKTAQDALASLATRYKALAETPPPEPDYSAHDARIAQAEAELATLRQAHEALVNAPPPQPDTSAWEARLAAVQFEVVKWQAAYQDAQAKLMATPAVDTAALEKRLDELQALLDQSQAQQAEMQARVSQLDSALTNAQRFETVGRLTSDVAQDFAQMLNVINGALEVMSKQPETPENIKRLSEAALTAGKRGERLTRQLQAFQSEEF
ncbi:PAS domain S-box protein [Asticcacaulis sp. 201]|uniref:PAS domain S-box protein n=1 Tax=Asticcacaulis sp. 201 TaxID=3028787 RepID=UPI002916E39D|nr:PAS domain S-box protein [Asticcacaulis sp. 201]MDV6332386.1 PAS domain S-box protein [Asticcacaulis sp. 201]